MFLSVCVDHAGITKESKTLPHRNWQQSQLYVEEQVANVGSSQSNNANSSSAIGSTIKVDGNVNIISTKGDITTQGATISAGQNTGTLTINAANNINLLASQSTNQSAGQNKNAGLEVGVGYQVGAQTGAYAYAAANVGSEITPTKAITKP